MQRKSKLLSQPYVYAGLTRHVSISIDCKAVCFSLPQLLKAAQLRLITPPSASEHRPAPECISLPECIPAPECIPEHIPALSLDLTPASAQKQTHVPSSGRPPMLPPVVVMPSGLLAAVSTLLPELLLRGPAVGMDKPPATWPPASPSSKAITEVKVLQWTSMEGTYFVPAAFTPAQISYPSMPSTAQLECDALVPASSKPLVRSQVTTSAGGCCAVMAVHWAAAEAAPGINIPSVVQVHAVIESTGLVDTSSPGVPTQLTTLRWVISCTMAVAVMPSATLPTCLLEADSPVPTADVVASQAVIAVAVADFRRTRVVAYMLGMDVTGVRTTGFWEGVVVKPVSGTHSLGCGAGLAASLAGSMALSDVLSLTTAGRLITSRSALLPCALHGLALAS